MKHHERTFVGVWLDHNHALLISTDDKQGHGDYAVQKKVEAHSHGDHSSSNENAHNHAQRQLREKYYHQVALQLEGYHDILLFGPGKAQEELFNHLKENKHFHGKNISIDSAGNLTENQMLARVRDFFKPFVHAH